MGYELAAIIGNKRLLESQKSRYVQVEVVSLHKELAIIPAKSEFLAEINASYVDTERANSFPDFSNGFSPEKLSQAVVYWLEDLSISAPVMYCEAEYFGGSGGQLALVWQNRQVVLGPICTRWGQVDQPLNVSLLSNMAINRALKKLGVEAPFSHLAPGTIHQHNLDEFDTVRLGRHRHTQDWH